MGLLAKVQGFATYLQTEKSVSQRTVNSYCSDVERFLEYIQERSGGAVLFSNITSMTIRAYLNYLNNMGYARHTIVRRATSLRSFFRYLSIRGFVDGNPVSEIYLPVQEKKNAIILEVKEMEALLNLPGMDLLGRRDKALLELLYGTGVRVTEAIALLLKDVDTFTGRIFVYGKGKKGRLVPIGKQGISALSNYIKNIRPQLCNASQPHTYLFVNNKGGPLSERSVRRIIDRYVSQFASDKVISPKCIRKSLAVHLLQNGADISFVWELLGPLSIISSDCHTKKNIKEIYKNAHPRA